MANAKITKTTIISITEFGLINTLLGHLEEVQLTRDKPDDLEQKPTPSRPQGCSEDLLEMGPALQWWSTQTNTVQRSSTWKGQRGEPVERIRSRSLHIQNVEAREDPRFQDKGTWGRWLSVKEWIETFQGKETCLRNRGFKTQTKYRLVEEFQAKGNFETQHLRTQDAPLLSLWSSKASWWIWGYQKSNYLLQQAKSGKLATPLRPRVSLT